jgi:hypothetical protein
MKKAQHVFLGQPVTVALDTETDLSTATTAQIRFVKPGGGGSFKDATIAGRIISAEFAAGELDTAGEWEFRSWVEFGAGTGFVPGTPFKHRIATL